MDLEKLQSTLHIHFKEKKLLLQAFTHASYINENPDFDSPDNERLEFLGDAVLNFITSQFLYHTYPDLSEGEMTEIRATLIREETLARLATKLFLGKYILLSHGEDNSGGRTKKSNLANTFESLLGAIFLDQGLDKAEEYTIPMLKTCLKDMSFHQDLINYKGKLQEYTQLHNKQLPSYHLSLVSGPDHDRNFTVEVIVANQTLGRGSGKSKKIAEMEAAKIACDYLGI